MLVQLLDDAIKNIDAEAQDAQDAVGDSAAAQDPHGDAPGEGAGARAVGRRQSQRTGRAVQHGCSAYSSADNWCDLRKQLGVVSVSGAAGMPAQGCFCGKECPGQAGECTNQVPPIQTDNNVEVLDSYSVYGKCLVAKRDIVAGEILTVFGGGLVKQLTHSKSYALFSDIHAEQQKSDATQQKFEYSAQTGSYGMADSQAWVIPPEDMPLLEQRIRYWRQHNTHLHNLVKHRETWQQGLGQFAQHTCCPTHVNAYFFPICIMHKAPQPPRGGKRPRDEEVIDTQALAIRAQKAISKGDEILVHYVGAGKSGDYVFVCRCCQCLGGGVCSG